MGHKERALETGCAENYGERLERGRGPSKGGQHFLDLGGNFRSKVHKGGAVLIGMMKERGERNE